MSETTVTVSEMRRWANSIFDAVEAQGLMSVDLQGRFYWMFDTTEIWRSAPPEPMVGDLSEDLEDIRRGVSEPDVVVRGAHAWHTLDHFIGALTKLSADLKKHDFDGAEDAS